MLTMGVSIGIEPILEIINRPVGDSSITVGVVILAFIFFYIVSQYGGGKWK